MPEEQFEQLVANLSEGADGTPLAVSRTFHFAVLWRSRSYLRVEMGYKYATPARRIRTLGLFLNSLGDFR
jgi:hypothetical protein